MWEMIEAGNEKQLEWGEGNWIILDIGFSGARNARGRTCGLVIGNSEAEGANFAEATQRIVEYIAGTRSLVNLVIEAPLSVCFSAAGLPTGRSIEWKGGEQRYWCTGPGCAVMVAAMYLIGAIREIPSPNIVRLFEAFISYKTRGTGSDHKREARLLRDAVRYPRKFPARIIPAKDLKERKDDDLHSAFRIMGLDCDVPAVIAP
jgi:hypothetical protein